MMRQIRKLWQLYLKKNPFKSRNVNIESKFFNENCESKQGFFGTNYYCEFNTDQDDEFKS